METSPTVPRLHLPDSLHAQLLDFRRFLWRVKLIEAVCVSVFGVLVAFLTLFALDRVWDTPVAARLAISGCAILACMLIPLALHRWIWRHHRFDQLAQLLSHKHPSFGDQLLGIIELVRSEAEQARSPALCEAAIGQVAEQAQRFEFRAAVPNPRHRRHSVLAATAGTILIILLVIYPAAMTNACVRFIMPWRNTPRYTFTSVESLPDQLVVAHGEPFRLKVDLSDRTVWRPGRGRVQLGSQPPVEAPLRDGSYQFELPSQIETGSLSIRIGDLSKQIRIEPVLRPELTSMVAHVSLPEYLGRLEPLQKDVRSGQISLVNGSAITLEASASRDLAAAEMDGQPIRPDGASFSSGASFVDVSREMQFQWRDRSGLAGKEPFVLSITARDDEAPSLVCDDLPRQKVVLDSELLSFKLKAMDDFGIRHVGIEWQGIDEGNASSSVQGERILAAGGYDQDLLELAGTFSAQSLDIDPQPIQLRLFAEDYYPNRDRVYSSPYLLHILNADQHALWLTEQLSKWHRQSLEVREREMQLYETNKQLHELSPRELNEADTRLRIEKQANAERANARRLSNLVNTGEELVRQATRNPEFGVGHLEKWAEMLQILKDISANRMPSVAELLKQASQATPVAMSSPAESSRVAGQMRATGSGSSPEESPKQEKDVPAVPRIADTESSQQPPNKQSDSQPNSASKSQSSGRLGLPTTTLLGASDSKDSSCPVEQKMEQAVTKQQDLLAEFDKVADELNRVLANLEGSTLVKRLKAASRMQDQIAGRIGTQVSGSFGNTSVSTGDAQRKVFGELATQETKSSQDVSNIMDDMQAYFERRRAARFQTVLNDMRKQDAIGALRQLADDIPTESGISMAQCEYWSDTFDRWAEDLVDPASGGS